MNVKMRNAWKILIGKSEGKRPLGRSRRRWDDNIKMDLWEKWCGGVEWIQLTLRRHRWRAFLTRWITRSLFCMTNRTEFCTVKAIPIVTHSVKTLIYWACGTESMFFLMFPCCPLLIDFNELDDRRRIPSPSSNTGHLACSSDTH
jgi:hypothetical protein